MIPELNKLKTKTAQIDYLRKSYQKLDVFDKVGKLEFYKELCKLYDIDYDLIRIDEGSYLTIKNKCNIEAFNA